MVTLRIKKEKIIKLLSYLINNKAFISLIFSLFVLLLAVSIWLFFPVSSSGVHYYSIGLYILLLLGIAIFISYKKDISIPLIKTILKKEHNRAKTKHRKKNRKSIITKTYLKILHYLILLFKNSQDSFEDLKEDIFDEFSDLVENIKGSKKGKKKQAIFIKVYLNVLRYIGLLFKYISLLFKSSGDGFTLSKDNVFNKFDKLIDEVKEDGDEDKFKIIRQTINKIKKKEKIDKGSLEKLEKEMFEFSKFKQKKATIFSLTAISAIIIVAVASGLISSFLFPEVFKTRAASYGFVQTSWSGGAFADTAIHPGDETDWVKYFSKDNVSTSTPTELRLSLTDTTIWSETSDSDWNTHATTSTYYLSGSIGIMKPNGLTCTTASECTSGFCIDGYCCNNACTADCNTCDDSGNEGTCSGLTVNEDGSCTGVCTSCVVGTCTNRSADDTTEGCATNCYDCVSGSCSAVTQADDGGCSGSSTQCVAGSCINCGGYWQAGFSRCWYFGNLSQSCDSVCATHGGCVVGGWDDTSSCTVGYALYPSATDCICCNSSGNAPFYQQEYTRFIRGTGTTQSCSASSGAYNRLCVCNN